MLIQEFIKHIEADAPPGLAFEWDKSGTQVAGTRQKVNTVAMALDPDESTIEKALEHNADFILTHHPLTLKPSLPSTPGPFHRILKLLLCSGTTLYSAHTSLDANPRGPAWWLARDLELKNTKVLMPVLTENTVELTFNGTVNFSEHDSFFSELISDAPALYAGGTSKIQLPEKNLVRFMDALHAVQPGIQCSIQKKPGQQKQFGLGFYGELPGEIDFKVFIARLKSMLGIDNIFLAGRAPARISTVACCPGSGADLAGAAFQAGAQVFITGDVKFHQAQDAQVQGTLLDAGHFSLEEIMMQKWHQKLKEQFKHLEIIFIKGRSPFRLI